MPQEEINQHYKERSYFWNIDTRTLICQHWTMKSMQDAKFRRGKNPTSQELTFLTKMEKELDRRISCLK